MKAISLWEPWASLMCSGAKTIETRGWRTSYRGDLLICASRHRVLYELHDWLCRWHVQGGLAPLVGKPLDLEGKTWPGVNIRDLQFGNAVCVVELYDCVPSDDLTLGDVKHERHFGDFTPGRFAWLTRNLRQIEPFAVRGKQGLFEVTSRFAVRRYG